MGFLISEPGSTSCTRLSEIMNISHDSVNRFLEREDFEPVDLFNESKDNLNIKGGVLSVDDSVLDKPYSQYMSFVSHFWSGKHHRVVKGINLITLYYTDLSGQHQPVNFRIYDKAEGKTKNDYFQEMLNEVISWGLKPAFVTGDAWYSGTPNLKKVKNHQAGFMFAVESNRTVSLQKGIWQKVQTVDVPDEGIKVWLKDFGEVILFRTMLKNQQRHYIVFLPKKTEIISRQDFLKIHNQHSQIEQYHRAIKQIFHVEHFQIRNKKSIKNHIFAAIFSVVHLQKMRASEMIVNLYQHQRELYKKVVASFINSFVTGKEYLKPQF